MHFSSTHSVRFKKTNTDIHILVKFKEKTKRQWKSGRDEDNKYKYSHTVKEDRSRNSGNKGYKV